VGGPWGWRFPIAQVELNALKGGVFRLLLIPTIISASFPAFVRRCAFLPEALVIAMKLQGWEERAITIRSDQTSVLWSCR
jgi:hypothetical protein